MAQLLKAILYTPLFNALIFLVWLMPHNQIGWAIIILTLIMRIALLPFTIHTARVQVKMKALQPKIDELRVKHKDDKTLQSQSLMALYKEEGVSPFSSCLPLIVQLVVLIVLYNVFRNGLNTAHFNILYSFVPHPAHVNTNFFGVDLSKPDRIVLPIIAGLTQLWQAKVTFVPSTNPDDSMGMISKQMIYLAPIMTFVFAQRFPAALPLYWIVTNLFSVAQQEYVIKRQGLAPARIPAAVLKEAAESDKDVKTPDKVIRGKSGVTVTIKKK